MGFGGRWRFGRGLWISRTPGLFAGGLAAVHRRKVVFEEPLNTWFFTWFLTHDAVIDGLWSWSSASLLSKDALKRRWM